MRGFKEITPERRREIRAIWSGVLLAVAPKSLFQDWKGREGYAEWALNHWTDSKWSVPLAFAAIVFALYLLGKNAIERQREGKGKGW